MAPWKAASVGDHIDQVDTPALVLDLDAFERNMKLLQDAVSSVGVRLRPHAKSHKCPEIALRQIELGAVAFVARKLVRQQSLSMRVYRISSLPIK